MRRGDTLRTWCVSLLLSACGAGGGDDDTPPPVDGADVPQGCIDSATRATKTVTVTGQVVDFTSGDPVAGATVDITTAWDVMKNIPRPDCPVPGTATTDSQGRFGPLDVMLGSTQNPPVVLFTVSGGGRARTLSDNRTCAAATCTLDHTIAAPASGLDASWRAELTLGGMTLALERGLVVFSYEEATGAPAAGVIPFQGTLVTSNLRAGSQARFVNNARNDLLHAQQTSTGNAGVAVIGIDAPDKAAYIGGRRGGDLWAGTGCLVEPGAIFVEDKQLPAP